MSLLLPSLPSTVISHQATPSLRIPSSLRQFHSPLPVSVTQSLFPPQPDFQLQAPNLHYSFIAWRVWLLTCYYGAVTRLVPNPLRPAAASHVAVCVRTSGSRSPPRVQTLTQISSRRPSDVRRQTSDWQSLSCRGLGGVTGQGPCQSCISKQPGVVAHPIIKRADCLRK